MRKLAVLSLILPFVISFSSFAQSFTRYKDTVWASCPIGSTSLHNDITPLDTSATGVTIKWKVVYCNFPADWVPGTGLCDNRTCYNLSGIWPTITNQISKPYTVTTTHDFHMLIDLTAATTKGLFYCTVKLADSANANDTLYSTFAVSCYPAAIPEVAKRTREVVLYPNPTTSEINVVYDAADDIKTISVFSIIGKAVAVYKPVTDNSANLALENVSAGIYFLRLINSKGEIVHEKKFTKQ